MLNIGETAPQANDAEARTMMLGIAESYEKLAQRAEKMAETSGQRLKAAKGFSSPAGALG
jgi:hypothetical protein